ncbi:MAG: DTW domain-containing protein [Deltaproteobacteria bacterium]|nr:MAG: DTW domain-containing protein [Deltaproteobacteria bacterium]
MRAGLFAEMNSAEPIRLRASGLVDRTEYRAACHSCRRPRAVCYCSLIEPFESEPRFIILIQPREAKHRLGTGRMAHLCLRNSVLLEGVDFSQDVRVNRELQSPAVFPVLLYPSNDAINLSRQSPAARAALVPAGRKLVVFVLDGTWKSVRKMLRLNHNLASLPAICFEPPSPSTYRIRRQPKFHCYSTIEAIHYVVDLFTPGGNEGSVSHRPHDNLRTVFNLVIDRQLAYSR